MPLDLTVPSQLMVGLLPEIVLVVGTLGLVLFASWRPASDAHQRAVGIASITVAVVTLGVVVYMALGGYTATAGVLAVDSFRWAASGIILLGTILTLALTIDYQSRERMTAPETHVLILLAASGMLLLAGSRDLILTFLGIELMSIPTYVLTAADRRSARSSEGGLKYFLLGAFSTAFLLYGMTLLYGLTGATSYHAIASSLAQAGVLENPLLNVGIALLLVGFGFKVAAVPFHVWAPDAYQGAPTPTSGFMAAAAKAAAFAAFLRLFIEVLAPAIERWHLAVWWIAVATMLVANLAALQQRNIKRLLAYSSIAHAGYIMIALAVGAGDATPGTVVTGSGAFLFYLFAYTLATMGAFAVAAAIGERGEQRQSLDDYAGLWAARPGLALAMSVFMLALLGFPVFGGIGFFAKWYMLQAALRGGAEPQTRLAVMLVLTSLLSAGYYLSVVASMFMRARPADAPEVPRLGRFTGGVIAVTALLILVFGFAPSQVLRTMSRSTLRPIPLTAPAAVTGAPTVAAPVAPAVGAPVAVVPAR